LVDRLNNEQLAFSNVIMAYATYTEYSSVLHDIAVWDNTSGMKAVVFRTARRSKSPGKPPTRKSRSSSLTRRAISSRSNRVTPGST
jgi:hypothetical protein